MKQSKCNHGTLKKCVKLGEKEVKFPDVDYPYKAIEFYMCDKCKKEFNIITSVNESGILPTDHDVMQACIDQIKESDFEVPDPYYWSESDEEEFYENLTPEQKEFHNTLEEEFLKIPFNTHLYKKQINMSEFNKYRRSQIAEIREVEDFDIGCFKAYGKIEYETTGLVSISQADLDNGSPKIGDMIGRNPKNHKDQWLIAEKYFKDNFEQID